MLLKIYYTLFKVFFQFLLKIHGPSSISSKVLVRPFSYRLEKNANKDPWIGLRYFIRALRLWTNDKEQTFLYEKSHDNIAIFHENPSFRKTDYKYLTFILNKPRFCFSFWRENVGIKGSYLKKLFGCIFQFMLFLVIFPITLFYRKRRASIALIQYNIPEWYISMQLLKKYNIQYLYYYGGYENDANIHTLLINSIGIKVHKICSSNPLTFYKYLIADAFSFTAPFQIEESKQYSKNWFVPKTYLWPNYKAEFLNNITKKQAYNNRYKLGYISSGSWVRKEFDQPDPGYGLLETENKIIAILKKLQKKQKVGKIVILLHRLEKETTERYNKSIAYYSEYFGENNIFIPKQEIDSTEIYPEVDLCVASHSSANIERLFMGYKTFYCPIHFKKKTLFLDELDNISIKNENDFVTEILDNIEISNEQFFKKYHIEKYSRKFYFTNSNKPIYNTPVM